MFKIIVDDGKPYEIEVRDEYELNKELIRLCNESRENEYAYFDVVILNEDNEDITESQFISEMVSEIMEVD